MKDAQELELPLQSNSPDPNQPEQVRSYAEVPLYAHSPSLPTPLEPNSDSTINRDCLQDEIQNEKSVENRNRLYSRVESRMASSYWDDVQANGLIISETFAYKDSPECTLTAFWGGFSRNSAIRSRCFHMFVSAKWRAIFVTINLANCIYLAAVPELYQDEFNAVSQHKNISRRALVDSRAEGAELPISASAHSRALLAVVSQPTPFADFFEAFCVAALAMEVLVGCIAVGFAGSERSYLRSSYFHQLDFAILLLTILEYVLLYTQGVAYFSFRAFRLLRLLQPILGLDFFRDVKHFLATLSRAAPQLATITVVLVLFLLAFSVLGGSLPRASASQIFAAMPRSAAPRRFLSSCCSNTMAA